MAADQHYLVGRSWWSIPETRLTRSPPASAVIIAGAIREALAGAPLTLARAPSAASLKEAGVTVHIDQGEVDAVVREVLDGDPIIAPPVPARLEVSRTVRSAITSAIRRLGLVQMAPKVDDLLPMLVRNVDQGQINTVHAELWGAR